ncbi:MAG: SulP family inorganic anion transporter [Proteobacteria bacterium]|nr:SulP family inorganic anion transporter [Pseudomonadota bacterium]
MLLRFFPFLSWFKDYSLTAFRVDAIAGLTVALVLIPQSMAYAQLAGLPPYYGLYASFLPPMIAALFGSSRQLATGPVAIVSLMTAASLSPLATTGSEGYIAYAILLALLVGVFQLALGLFKLGVVVNFLSHPVVNGFTNAGAIIIASSQLSKMFGVYVDTAEHHYETIARVVEAAFHYTHWPTLWMGALAFAVMYALKRLAPKVPNVLVAVALTTLISWGFGFSHNAKVDVSTIQSPKARQLVSDFNQSMKDMEPLAEARKEATLRIEAAKAEHDPIAILDAEHEANVLSARIEALKHKAHEYREQIRYMLFGGVKAPDGSLAFYEKGALPQGAEGDGRTWRIRVGNNALAPAALTMTGGGAVIGEIPRGLPSLTVPRLDVRIILHLLPFAVIISLLGFMEAISIAKAMAAKTGQRLDPNQELIGQGLANILGAIGKSYPASGSFSRSAVNLQAGAVSGLSSVFTSLTVVIVLLFFTPLLFFLPQSVLAAVIMLAVIGLINVTGFVHAWRTQWYDGAISIISFIATLVFAPDLDRGIMIGVVLSLCVFLYKSMRPTVASLSRHEDEAFRDALAFGLKECEHIDMVRFDGPLFFANASYLEDQITERMMKKKDLKHIIIAANGISDMDASGEETLSLLIDRVRSAGVDISFSSLTEPVMEVFKRTHLLEKIGPDHIYSTREKALRSVHETAHQQADEQTCPLTTVCRVV